MGREVQCGGDFGVGELFKVAHQNDLAVLLVKLLGGSLEAAFQFAPGRFRRRRWLVVVVGLSWVAGNSVLAARLGAEFVPNLDEGVSRGRLHLIT